MPYFAELSLLNLPSLLKKAYVSPVFTYLKFPPSLDHSLLQYHVPESKLIPLEYLPLQDFSATYTYTSKIIVKEFFSVCVG